MTWALLRSTGVIALALLSLSVVLGIAGPAIRRPSARLTSVSVHRAAAAAGTLLIVGHVVLAVLDSWVQVPAVAVILPGASSWESLWIGLGAVALDLIAVVMVSSALRQRSARTWWRLHVLAYPAWAVAFGHAFGVGTDRTSPLMVSLAVLSLVAVGGALTVRVRAPHAPVGVAMGPATVVLPTTAAVVPAGAPTQPSITRELS